ncbi:hypothetical protein Peur_025223 [Populus x canadensis]
MIMSMPDLLFLHSKHPRLFFPAHLPLFFNLPPPPACALCRAILPPIPEIAPVCNPLESVTVEDCSTQEGLDEALLEEEQLDFSFTDDDGEDTPLLSPPAGLSEGRPPSTVVVEGCASPTNTVAGTSLASPPGNRCLCRLGLSFIRKLSMKLCPNSVTTILPTPTRVQEQNSSPLASGPSADPTATVIMDNAMAPCVASEGWITVEPRQKSNKHIHGNPKGKEVIAVEVVSGMNPYTELPPSVCVDVIGTLGAEASVGAGSPNDAPPLEELVTHPRKQHNPSNTADNRTASTPFASPPVRDG